MATSRIPDAAASSTTSRRHASLSRSNPGCPKPKTSASGSMTWWLWKSRKSEEAAIARPTVIFPTAGGPITTRSSPEDMRGG